MGGPRARPLPCSQTAPSAASSQGASGVRSGALTGAAAPHPEGARDLALPRPHLLSRPRGQDFHLCTSEVRGMAGAPSARRTPHPRARGPRPRGGRGRAGLAAVTGAGEGRRPGPSGERVGAGGGAGQPDARPLVPGLGRHPREPGEQSSGTTEAAGCAGAAGRPGSSQPWRGGARTYSEMGKRRLREGAPFGAGRPASKGRAEILKAGGSAAGHCPFRLLRSTFEVALPPISRIRGVGARGADLTLPVDSPCRLFVCEPHVVPYGDQLPPHSPACEASMTGFLHRRIFSELGCYRF